MKRLILITIVLGLLLVGCAPSYQSGGLTTEPKSVTNSDEPPADRTWISPGKVQIGNFYPGARAEWDITIHNGEDTTTEFSVSYRVPDYVAEGYEKAPDEVQDWVIIADPTPILAPKETRDILIVAELPEEVKDLPPKWEFWISIIDVSQKGMVQTELASRWLVVMR